MQELLNEHSFMTFRLRFANRRSSGQDAWRLGWCLKECQCTMRRTQQHWICGAENCRFAATRARRVFDRRECRGSKRGHWVFHTSVHVGTSPEKT